MNIDTMTLDQIRDYIAECKGYTKHISHWHAPDDDGFGHVPLPHPVPDTLDAAADALPDGWQFYRITYEDRGRFPACACARRNGKTAVLFGEGIIKKEAMFRAAAKAWQKERMAAKTLIIDPDKVTKESIEALMKDYGLIEELRAVAAWPVQSKVTSAAPSYPVSQTWTLPTDTYPDGEVYIAAGDWTLWDTMRHIQNITKFTWPNTDASAIKWRPTDVPKAEEVKEPVYRISKSDRRLVLNYIKIWQDCGLADARLLNVRSRLLQSVEVI